MVRLMFLYLLLEVSIENEKTDTLTLQHQAQLCLPVLPKLSTVSTLNLGCAKRSGILNSTMEPGSSFFKSSWV